MYFNILHISILIFSIATIIFYKLEVKRPFKKLYQSLTRDELIDDNQALSDLFKILYSKTNMELAIFNSKIGRMLYSISFLVAGICPFILKEYVGKIISYFLAGFFLFLPDIYVYSKRIYNRKLLKEISLQNWMDFLLVLCQKYLKLALYLLYCLSSLIFVMLLLLLLDQYLQLDKGLNPNILLSGAVNSTINTTLFYESKPLDVISGNKLSFSGILFTLGIGGTVIFSLIDYYNKQNEIINRDAIEIKNYYQKWFQLNQSNLDFNPNKYTEFNSAVDRIRDEFNPYIKINNSIKRYQFARMLIILIYIMGIFTIIGSDLIIEIIFKLFPFISIFFIFVIFSLFNNSYNLIPSSAEKINLYSEKDSTLSKSTSSIQDSYRDVISEKDRKAKLLK